MIETLGFRSRRLSLPDREGTSWTLDSTVGFHLWAKDLVSWDQLVGGYDRFFSSNPTSLRYEAHKHTPRAWSKEEV